MALRLHAKAQESGCSLRVVGDVSGKDFHAVEVGGFFACDGGGVEEAFFFDDFNASSGVVGWDDFPLVFFKVAAALRQRLRMRINGFDVFEFGLGVGDEDMGKFHCDFAADFKVVGEEQVVVLVDAALNGVFNRNNACLNSACFLRIRRLRGNLCREQAPLCCRKTCRLPFRCRRQFRLG